MSTPQDIFKVPALNFEDIAYDIAKTHYKSAFTDQESLKRWIFSALKLAHENGKRSVEVEKETECLRWLEVKIGDKL